MKSMKHNYILFALAITVIFSSCRKDNDTKPDDQEVASLYKGLYILSEGSINNNNSSLTYYDYGTKITTANLFFTANGRGIGDTGNDLQVYGSKMYIVVNVSNTVEVVDAKTAKSIKQISFVNGNVGRQPRYIVFNKNKAFISSFDGTVAVMDTTTLAIEKYITVGRNPEKMGIANGKLYVANSGGLDPENYDNTVSVIDLNTLSEIKKITVTINPRGVIADQYGDIYVLSTGNYGTIKPDMAVIDSKTDLVTQTFANFGGGSMAINGDVAYIAGTTYDENFNATNYVKLFNVKTEKLLRSNFITDGTVITSPYGINVDPVSGEVFITDAKNYSTNGEVFCFNSLGVKKYSLTTGISPSKIIFLNK